MFVLTLSYNVFGNEGEYQSPNDSQPEGDEIFITVSTAGASSHILK